MQVICLCAAWCRVCNEYRPLFDEAATQHPHMRFAWVDVEDEDEAMGDVDIETFPTLLVAQGEKALFLGPVDPTVGALARLVDGLQARAADAIALSPEAQALLARLANL